MKQFKRYLKKPTLQLTAAILLFFVSVQASRGIGVPEWEITLFRAIYELPGFFQPFFFVVTQFGSVLVLGILLLLFLVLRHYSIVLRLLLTGTLAYLVSGVAKDLFGRVRPNEVLIDVVNLDYIVRGPGFPSGHTALATAIGLTLLHYVPKKYRPFILIMIGLVGISRMSLGIHFPLDIVGGVAIGWASYALFRHVRLYDASGLHKKKSIQTSKKKPRVSKRRLAT